MKKIFFLLFFFLFGCIQSELYKDVESYNSIYFKKEKLEIIKSINEYYKSIDYILISIDEKNGKLIFKSNNFSIEGVDVSSFIKSQIQIDQLDKNHHKITLLIFQSNESQSGNDIKKDILIKDRNVYQSFFSKIKQF